MKSKFVVAALGALLSLSVASPRANAQTEAAPAPAVAPDFGPENMRAIALLGNAYNDFVQSPAYRGHLVWTKITFKPGTGTVAKVLDWKSTWENSGEGQFSKRALDATYTLTRGATTTTEKFSGVDEGTATKRLYSNRQMWSERPIISESDVSLNFARVPLQIAVILAAQNAPFEIVTEKRDGKDVRIVRVPTVLEVVLDPATNAIKSWKAEKKDGETSSCVWLSQELNPTLKADDWAFKVPPTTKKVAADTVNLNLEF